MKPKIKGFTLIELLIVISIIGILSAVVLSFLSEARSKSRFSTIYNQLNSVAKAAYIQYIDAQAWAPDRSPGQAPTFVGTYIASWPSPPCTNWTYDWENWGNNTIRITVRNSSQGGTGANGIYYYCIESNVSTCDSSGPTGGVDIKTVASKSTTCNE